MRSTGVKNGIIYTYYGDNIAHPHKIFVFSDDGLGQVPGVIMTRVTYKTFKRLGNPEGPKVVACFTVKYTVK